MTPSVDIVIPLYDKAHVLPRAVDAVLAQTYPHWRLTIVDDGSTDDVESALARYADEARIRVIRQPNAGPGAARNRGLRDADALWVCFLDADDEWLPEFLERQLATLAVHPRAVAVAASWHHDSGRRDSHSLRIEHGLLGEWVWGPDAEYAQLRRRVDVFHSSAVVVRRDVVSRLGGFFDRTRCLYGEDSFLWMQVLVSEPTVIVDARLLHFHSDASTLSVGRSDPYPLPPALEFSSLFLAALPPDVREWMRGYLIWYAEFILRRSVRESAFGQARRVGRIVEEDLGMPRADARLLVRRSFTGVFRDRLSRLRWFGNRIPSA